jgi:hypothetical protein
VAGDGETEIRQRHEGSDVESGGLSERVPAEVAQ